LKGSRVLGPRPIKEREVEGRSPLWFGPANGKYRGKVKWSEYLFA